MILIRKHEQVLAVCDKNLIGKKFKKGKLCLNVSKRFYFGDEISIDKLKVLLSKANNVNIIGKESIAVAVEMGLIKKEEVIYIEGVPHAQFIVL